MVAGAQRYVRWNEPPEATHWLDSVTITSFADTSAVLVVAESGFEGRLFRIDFRSTVAIMAHDEHSHPLAEQDDAELPSLDGATGAYPFLKVENSAWAASFCDHQRGMEEALPQHYLIITLNNYVDVLSYSTPFVSELAPDSWERLFDPLFREKQPQTGPR